jgi:hypothetical protein
MSEMQPCPFCGSVRIIKGERYFAMCVECGATGPERSRENTPENKWRGDWNSRPPQGLPGNSLSNQVNGRCIGFVGGDSTETDLHSLRDLIMLARDALETCESYEMPRSKFCLQSFDTTKVSTAKRMIDERLNRKETKE